MVYAGNQHLHSVIALNSLWTSLAPIFPMQYILAEKVGWQTLAEVDVGFVMLVLELANSLAKTMPVKT